MLSIVLYLSGIAVITIAVNKLVMIIRGARKWMV